MTSPTSLFARAHVALAEGADLERLAELVTSEFGGRDGPVPIEEVCAGLGADLVSADLEGAAGALVAGAGLRRPLVVVRDGDAARRRRFTIAHELAHLLLGHFALQTSPGGSGEAQADRLAALLLVPPSRIGPLLEGTTPDVEGIRRVADAFDISVEAAARAYAEFHPEPVAVVIVRDGKVERCYRARGRFPYVLASIGDPVPDGSIVHRVTKYVGEKRWSSDVACPGWVRHHAGDRRCVVEQVRRWRSGSSLVLLRLTAVEARVA